MSAKDSKPLTGRETNPPARIYWLDVARAVAVVSITLNHAVNRTFENYHNQMGGVSEQLAVLLAVKDSGDGVQPSGRAPVPDDFRRPAAEQADGDRGGYPAILTS